MNLELMKALEQELELSNQTIKDMLEALEVRDITGLMEKGHDHIIKVCELITQIAKERINDE